MIDPEFFVATRHLKVGQRCRWFREMDGAEGAGVITLIWFGIEEMVDIETDEGLITLCPELGDTITLRPSMIDAGTTAGEPIRAEALGHQPSEENS